MTTPLSISHSHDSRHSHHSCRDHDSNHALWLSADHSDRCYDSSHNHDTAGHYTPAANNPNIVLSRHYLHIHRSHHIPMCPIYLWSDSSRCWDNSRRPCWDNSRRSCWDSSQRRCRCLLDNSPRRNWDNSRCWAYCSCSHNWDNYSHSWDSQSPVQINRPSSAL